MSAFVSVSAAVSAGRPLWPWAEANPGFLTFVTIVLALATAIAGWLYSLRSRAVAEKQFIDFVLVLSNALLYNLQETLPYIADGSKERLPAQRERVRLQQALNVLLASAPPTPRLLTLLMDLRVTIASTGTRQLENLTMAPYLRDLGIAIADLTQRRRAPLPDYARKARDPPRSWF